MPKHCGRRFEVRLGERKCSLENKSGYLWISRGVQ